jgi:hypothetical protein
MRTDQHQAAIDALEVRLLRLLQIERMCRNQYSPLHLSSVTDTVADEVERVGEEWREAVKAR